MGGILSRGTRGHGRLDELDPVAERVSELEPLESRNGDALQDLDSRGGQALPPAGEVVDGIGDVGLGGPAVHCVLDANVYLTVADPEPEAAAFAEAFRLLDLRQAEDAAVEGPRRRNGS